MKEQLALIAMSIYCLFPHGSFAQESQVLDISARRPVLVDDIRSAQILSLHTLVGLDSIPALTLEQKHKIKSIENKYLVDLTSIENKRRTLQLDLKKWYNQEFKQTKSLEKTTREFAKLDSKQKKLYLKKRKKIRAILDKEQQLYFDRLVF